VHCEDLRVTTVHPESSCMHRAWPEVCAKQLRCHLRPQHVAAASAADSCGLQGSLDREPGDRESQGGASSIQGSDMGLVFWDEHTSQQLYMTYPTPEATDNGDAISRSASACALGAQLAGMHLSREADDVAPRLRSTDSGYV
jgi:hypothetical protein